MTNKQVINTSNAPQNDNPYSQGVLTDGLLFISGQGPTDPDTGASVEGDIGVQTEQTLENLQAIVESAGGSLDDIVKTTVYLTDMGDYAAVNEVYGTYFESDPPARVCIEAAQLPGAINVEIEAFARVK